VVGGGLAGLTAALTLLDRGARVILLEKEAYAGGNSRWASSGINGVDVETVAANPDSVASFREDCEKSSLGGGAREVLRAPRARVRGAPPRACGGQRRDPGVVQAARGR
jgi:succinate dehydrogenase/fumarate reductase flavoprotein subunit